MFDRFLYMMNFDDRIRLILSEMEGNERGKKSRLAKLAGCTRALVTQWLNGERDSMGYEYAENISRNLGYSIDWILTGRGKEKPGPSLPNAGYEAPTDETHDLIPQLDLRASCGNGKFADHVVVTGGLAFKRSTLREWGISGASGRIIYAEGQSMEPTVAHGRVVLINLADTEPQDNKIFLICDSDGAMLLKRLVREYDPSSGNMTWKMRSDNSDKRQYPDKLLPANTQATIVGRAVWNDNLL